MELLISGLLIWSMVHFIPSLAPAAKLKLTGLLSETGYKLTFTVLIIVSLALIIFGWRSSTPSQLYVLPGVVRHVAVVLILLAFVLFTAAQFPTRIKNYIRHPQLTGVAVWALAHLLLNGDSRSVFLFGGLGVWAVLEIILINRRDREWTKKSPPGWTGELKLIAISIVTFIVVVMVHPYIAGVPIR